MRNLIFMLGLLSLVPLHSMDYKNLPEETFSEKLFVNTVLSGSLEAIDACVKDHNKTYFDVLKVCAKHNNTQAVAHALSKALPKKPTMPEQLCEFKKKQAVHAATWLCHVVPTTTYLDQNCTGCLANTAELLCCIPVNCANIIAIFTEPRMSGEVKSLHDMYEKELSSYREANECCKAIYDYAIKSNSHAFVKVFKEYKTNKLEKVEIAVKEFINE